MMMKQVKWCLALFGIMAFFMGSAYGQDLGAIKQRMEGRLGQINALKTQKVVGENNQGYLEFVGAARDGAVVEAENADRRQVYQVVASKTGGSAEQAGRARAKQIREQSAPGIMIQDETGRWVEKR
jgi:uncharacterized protein